MAFSLSNIIIYIINNINYNIFEMVYTLFNEIYFFYFIIFKWFQCDMFDTFRNFFSDELKISGECNFKSIYFFNTILMINDNTNTDKIMAGCYVYLIKLFRVINF